VWPCATHEARSPSFSRKDHKITRSWIPLSTLFRAGSLFFLWPLTSFAFEISVLRRNHDLYCEYLPQHQLWLGDKCDRDYVSKVALDQAGAEGDEPDAPHQGDQRWQAGRQEVHEVCILLLPSNKEACCSETNTNVEYCRALS